jgi:aminopeptidase N
MKYLLLVAKLLPGLLLVGTGMAVASDGPANTVADYQLQIELDPVSHQLDVTASITLQDIYAGQTVEFLLSDAVEIVSADPPVTQLPYDGSGGEDGSEGAKGFTGINGSSVDLAVEGHVARYRVTLPANSTALNISYGGAVNFALGGQKEQYTRGFQSTAGIVAEQGVFLAGSSLWYPYFGSELVSFSLTSNVPEGWQLISQGNGQSRDDAGQADWDSAGAVDEIYLVGGPLIKYAEPAGAVAAEVYLHEPDDALAQRYLTATAQYLEMYRNLIGPYPYSKFALVENFWETGYGMPSFTLLGPQIIRFPFILTSSYPHEVLHNWWGNSVFVAYDTGNWCEGLTAYMADHLMQEQRGRGAQYRRDTLKKYRDFVTEGRDFPLTEFRSRHSAATEAIGYGKVLMGFHMLRRELGDDVFKQAMARFYRSNRGTQASFDDVRAALEAASGADLEQFFEQWVQWTGAPDISVDAVAVREKRGKYRITGDIVQEQDGDSYDLSVPVYITTVDGLEIFTVRADSERTAFKLETESEPLLLEVDPEFDTFRLLDPRETAPSIGQIFGEQEIIAVLPAIAAPEKLQAYRELAESWQSPAHDIEIVLDTQLGELPADQAAWFFGPENRLAPSMFGGASSIDLKLGTDVIIAAGQEIPLEEHSAVIVRRHPDNEAMAVGWITVDPQEAFSGMSAKLPHYGKYSYLGFAGNEPTNMVKGEWQATDSPLRVDLRPAQERTAPLPVYPPPARNALAELPPVFSRDQLVGHVDVLAGEAMAGRGLGTPGLELAAEYIEQQFADLGLQPGATDGSFSQVFTVPEGEDGQPHAVRNIIGVLPGSNPDMQGEVVIVSAHYDHLGSGWPDVRAGDAEGFYYGADDNASGVAVLLEVAKTLALEAAPERSIVFIAFTAEEAGKLGSKYFVSNPQPYELDKVIGVINMDTVGRLEGKDISVFGAATADEWQHVFRGIGFTTGIGSQLITVELDSSDQQSFIDVGVPGVQISSGASFDYHRPSDTADKIDGDGLVKVAVFVKEAVAYLGARPEPLTVTIAGKAANAAAAPPAQPGSRRVSVGTVPDFAYGGVGVRIGSVVPDSPAAAAGLQAGDVLTAIDDEPVANLQAYSDLLKTLEPGQTATLTIERDGDELAVDVMLADR